MPIEFEEDKIGRSLRFSPNGRALGKAPAPKPKKEAKSILKLLIKLKIAKNEDYAKLYLLIIIIIASSLTIFFGVKTWQDFNPDINIAPIDLNQIQ